MKGKIEYKGKVYRSFNYLCRCFRRERSSVEYRLEHGMTLEQAIKTPKKANGRPRKEV